MFVAPLLVSPHGDELGSFSREPERNALTDAAARSRYDGHMSFQTVPHGTLRRQGNLRLGCGVNLGCSGG